MGRLRECRRGFKKNRGEDTLKENKRVWYRINFGMEYMRSVGILIKGLTKHRLTLESWYLSLVLESH